MSERYFDPVYTEDDFIDGFEEERLQPISIQPQPAQSAVDWKIVAAAALAVFAIVNA